MKKFNLRHMFLYCGIAVLIGIPFGLFVRVAPDRADELLQRLFNALFYGGLLVFAWGAIGVATNMGAFSLIFYSNKKVWQTLLRRDKDLGEKKLGSYFDYLSSRKKRPEVLEMILAGLIPVVVSLVISGFIYL